MSQLGYREVLAPTLEQLGKNPKGQHANLVAPEDVDDGSGLEQLLYTRPSEMRAPLVVPAKADSFPPAHRFP